RRGDAGVRSPPGNQMPRLQGMAKPSRQVPAGLPSPQADFEAAKLPCSPAIPLPGDLSTCEAGVRFPHPRFALTIRPYYNLVEEKKRSSFPSNIRFQTFGEEIHQCASCSSAALVLSANALSPACSSEGMTSSSSTGGSARPP